MPVKNDKDMLAAQKHIGGESEIQQLKKFSLKYLFHEPK